MELNIPKQNENEEETEWIEVKDLEVGASINLDVKHLHLGEKALVVYSTENQGVALFHTSDYDGQTLGERALIALGQTLNIEGKTSAEEVLEAGNNASLSMTISNNAFEKDGEARTYKRITFKVQE
mgnify:CR=1 FL=1